MFRNTWFDIFTHIVVEMNGRYCSFGLLAADFSYGIYILWGAFLFRFLERGCEHLVWFLGWMFVLVRNLRGMLGSWTAGSTDWIWVGKVRCRNGGNKSYGGRS